MFGMMEGNLVSNRQLLPWCLGGKLPLFEVRWQKDLDGFLMLVLLPFWNCEINTYYCIALRKCSNSQAALKEAHLAETLYRNKISALLKFCLTCTKCP